jgi:RNA polymerase sigma factor (sigma-70 family)
MRSDATDSELWARVRDDDDEQAFALLFSRYHRRVVRWVDGQLRGVSRADPTAVVSDAFHTFWRRRRAVQIESTAWPWLRAVATRLCANERRRCLRQDRLLHRTAVSAPVETLVVADHASAVADRMALTEALSRLGPLESQVAHLALVDDLPDVEVASRLRVPVGTVKSRLHRARRELRRHLQRRASD